MFNKYREPRVISISSSSDSESGPSVFNTAFQSSSAVEISTSLNSTNFTSTEAIHPTDTGDSDLRRIIENDTFLSRVSKNDSLQIKSRSPSLIIAAGTAQGSTLNSSIESRDSTILAGAEDSDASFYSPSETFTNFNRSAELGLNKRISTDEEFTDCESSPECQASFTISTASTKYKSLRHVSSPNTRSENNNNIFKEINDSGIALNAASFSPNKFSHLTRLQHLTTILEESTFKSNCNARRISGVQIMPIIEHLRKGPMPQIPKTAKFKETMSAFAHILDKSSREITVDQLAQILFFTLNTDYNYSDHLSESESYILSFREVSRQSGTDTDNTGKELDSIMRQLRIMYPHNGNIESESSPEWPSSLRASASRTTKNVSSGKINQRPSSSNKKKEYFPMPPSSNVECNKENLNSQKTSKETTARSPKKSRVHFSPELCQSSNFGSIQKKKYFTTPRFTRNEESSKTKRTNITTTSEDSFLFWEHLYTSEEKKIRRHLRRSVSMPNIVTEESTTSEVCKIDRRREKQKLQKTPRFVDNKTQEKTKKYRKRRSRSVEYRSHFPVQTNFDSTNDSSGRNLNLPSTSGVPRKRSSIQQRGKNSSKKLTVKFGNTSAQRTPTSNKIQPIISSKISSHRKAPLSSRNRRSCGIDSSHIPAVSQLRKVFSPADKALGPSLRILNIPRIEITKSSPDKSVNNGPTPILTSRCKRNLLKKQEKISPRKPWRP